MRAGGAYVDVGTLNGYRKAIALLSSGRYSGEQGHRDRFDVLIGAGV